MADEKAHDLLQIVVRALQQEIVSRDLAEGYGGKVVLARLLDRHFTTATLAKAGIG